MKKTIFTLSALTLALALTGCNDSDKSAQTDVKTQPEAEVTTQAPTVTNETDGMAKVPAVADQETTANNALSSANDAASDVQNDVTGTAVNNSDDVNSLPATAAGAAKDVNTAADNAIESATDSLNEAKETQEDK